MTSTFHVATTGSDTSDGSEDRPFRTINRAAGLAQAGDTRRRPRGRVPRMGAAAPRWAERPAPHHLRGRDGRARGHQGLRAGDGVGACRAGRCGGPPCRTRCSAPSTRSPRRSTATGSSTRPRAQPQKHLGDVYLNGRSFYEVTSLAEVSDPPLRTEVIDDWTGMARPGPRPRADAARVVRRGRGRGDDDLGELPGRRPEHRTRRDQRTPLRLLPDRASPRLHHGPRLRAGAGGLPLDPAHRRPARPDRPQLGEGLDHRGQRHPRRQVLGDLDRQGGVDRPQLRDRARRQAGLPVPARVGVRGASDRVGQGAHRLARHPAQHDLRLRPERHRRPPRVRLLHDRGQPHLQHRASSGSSTATRSAASSCTRPSTW